jgi:plastocyanin
MRRSLALLACVLAVQATPAVQEHPAVTGTIVLEGSQEGAKLQDVAVWLTPADEAAQRAATADHKARFRVLQKDKRFTPRILVVQVGSVVDFPNGDPFFHNVFSLYDGKRFDLGLYEAGTSRSVTFTRPGICYVFCNIHPEMSAVVVVVDTPYIALSTRTGDVALANVPPGRYVMSVWHERYTSAEAGAFPREVTISEADRDLGSIRLIDGGRAIAPHKNKYGRDYNPPRPESPVYK